MPTAASTDRRRTAPKKPAAAPPRTAKASGAKATGPKASSPKATSAKPTGAWAATPVVEARPPAPRPRRAPAPAASRPPAAVAPPVAVPAPPVPAVLELPPAPLLPVPVQRPAVTTFRGDSLVSALAAATEALGADVRVRSARRVRQGIAGLLGRQRFEVVAEAPQARHDGLDDAYAGLLGAADAREVTGATHPAPTRPAQPARPARAPRAAHAAPGTSWSRLNLRTVGVPDEVLAGLPEQDPADDLGWTVALGTAIAAVVPPPTVASAEHPVVIDGYGASGAVAIMRAALAGARPGRLHTEAGHAPATAAELAMAVRSCLVR